MSPRDQARTTSGRAEAETRTDGARREPHRHPNAALAWRAWNAVSRADVGALRTLLSEDVVWHATGANPWRGDHVGFDAVLDYLARVGELTDTFDAKLLDVLASDARVVIVFRALVARGAHRAEVDYLVVARIEGERACELWTLPLDGDAVARFWQDDAAAARAVNP